MRALLLGAGFSRNWGAPLSSEINGSLLSELHDDAQLANQLRNRPFEDLFSGFALPSGGDDAARRQLRLQSAVKATFDRVNLAFHPSEFEFRRQNFEIRFSVGTFLEKFDVIFTLNQDLLLETAYMTSGGRVRNATIPGMQRAPADSNIWRANGQHTLPFGPLIQPYIKLHGSTNWQSDAGESVLIMGNAKSGAIAKFPVLKWYHEVFETCLRRGNAKLMVIGYSFQDEHINNVICAASKDYKLETFIIDPLGTAVLRDPRMRDAHIPGPPRELEDITIVGRIRRTLKEIFSGDRFAVGEIERFFSS